MKRRYIIKALMIGQLLLWSFIASAVFSAQSDSTQSGHSIKVDIPVNLEKANVVFNMDHLAFSGDMPVGIKYMHLLANRFQKEGIKGRIVGIFHGDAAYMTLSDETYNVYRKVSTGNPYKKLIAELMNQGVQIEMCAVSMKAHNWVNEDLLPGVEVNGGAIARLIQLMQKGYSQIQP